MARKPQRYHCPKNSHYFFHLNGHFCLRANDIARNRSRVILSRACADIFRRWKLFQHCWGHARALRSYGLYPSHDALQVLTLLGGVAFVYTPLPTRTQQLTTLLAQQFWELFRSFEGSLTFLNMNLCPNKGYLFEPRNLVKLVSRGESKRPNLCTF